MEENSRPSKMALGDSIQREAVALSLGGIGLTPSQKEEVQKITDYLLERMYKLYCCAMVWNTERMFAFDLMTGEQLNALCDRIENASWEHAMLAAAGKESPKCALPSP